MRKYMERACSLGCELVVCGSKDSPPAANCDCSTAKRYDGDKEGEGGSDQP